MDCKRLDEQIDLYVAGELDGESAAELERHAEACADCRARLEAARRRLEVLDNELGRYRADEGFVARAMARVRAEAERPPEPLPPESLTTRLSRYAAMAAAAGLFLLAGYGLLRQGPSARFLRGPMARVGPQAAQLVPGAVLATNDVVATPAGAKEPALVDLGEGRLRVAVKPASVLRIADRRAGPIAHLYRGGLVCRARRGESPAIATPLACVAAGQGAVGVHVVPQGSQGGKPSQFRGTVALVAYDGWARVQVAGPRRAVVTLRPGQTLVLRSGRQPMAPPLPAAAIRKRYASQLGEVDRRLAHFKRQWDHVSSRVRMVPPEDHPRLFIDGVRLQAEIHKMMKSRGELRRRIELLEHFQDDPQALRCLATDR